MKPADRGTKHVCLECHCKFYDLKAAVVACPKCGTKPLPVKVRKVATDAKDVTRPKVWRYPKV